MIKLIAIFTLFYFSTFSVRAQTGKYKWLNNEKIEFDILLYSSRETDNGSISPTRRYVCVDLPRRFENGKDTLDAKEILKYLYDDESDFAANVLLYQIFEREATDICILGNTRDKWLICCKNEDIKYWEELLKE